MGLGRSKQATRAQPGFSNQPGFSAQPGFPTQPQAQAAQAQSGYATQGAFSAQPGFNTQFPHQHGFQLQPSFSPTQPFSAQAGFAASQGFSSNPGFPAFPAPSPMNGLPGTIFPQTQQPCSPSYPVSYTNQVSRPLIPGYASAPANDQRRSNVLAQEQDNDYASRYYADQQLAQMQQIQQLPQNYSGKMRKH